MAKAKAIPAKAKRTRARTPNNRTTTGFRVSDELWNIREGIPSLHAAHLPDAAAPFETHQYRIQSPVFRPDGSPIDADPTENALKQFKHRFCDPGMRRSRPGALRMTLIRPPCSTTPLTLSEMLLKLPPETVDA